MDSAKISSLMAKADSSFLVNGPENKNSYSIAFSYLKNAEAIAQQSENIDDFITINNKYAELWVKSGNYSLALEYAFKNLRLIDDQETQPEDLLKKKIFQYSFIGYCYVCLETPDKALVYLEKAKTILDQKFENSKDEYILDRKTAVLNNIASSYLSKGDIKQAKKYFNMAIVYFKKNYREDFLAAIYNNLGICEQHENHHELSRKYFEKSLKIRAKLKDTLGMAQSYNNLGTYYIAKNNNTLAVNYLKLALKMAQNSNGVKSEILAAKLLSELYYKSGNAQEAYQMLKLFNQMNDSVLGIERVRFTSQLELKYQFEKQKKEAELHEQMQQAKNQKQFLILTSIIVALLLLSVIYVLLYRTQKIRAKKNQLQKENLSLEKENLELNNKQLELNLEHKNKELTTNVMSLLRKNEFMQIIIQNLEDIKEELPEKEKIKIRQLISSINSNISDLSWDEFELRFQDVHQDFYKKLSDIYPNLTPNETKICSFLRLNMSTKDISSITFQSVKSIEVARTRLRKKLRLEREENLISLLQKI